MAVRHRDLPRLNIPNPTPMQPPPGMENQHPLFSPAGLHGPFRSSTPNPFYAPHHPGHLLLPPGRFSHQHRPSLAHLSAVGFNPQNNLPTHQMPVTPLGQYPHLPLGNVGGFGPHFPPRNRRTQSVSLGGPPKAILGGPARKTSPFPQQTNNSSNGPSLSKKVIVNLPKETIPGVGGRTATRPEWARVPEPVSRNPSHHDVGPPELTSCETYPPEVQTSRTHEMVKVVLPQKNAWEVLRHRAIEEKLEKLGVERGAASSMPEIRTPHTRAASQISSPADPALLFYKLNQLQRSQAASATTSLSSSPQPPHMSPSPTHLLPKFPNRNVQTMSHAPQPLLHRPMFPIQTAPLDSSAQAAVIAPDGECGLTPLSDIHAPRGRVPPSIATLAAPYDGSLSRPSSRDSRPDYNRGFGLDIPEEEEEIDTNPAPSTVLQNEVSTNDSRPGHNEDFDADQQDDTTTVANSRLHSRHVSRLSATLSSRTFKEHHDVSPGEAQDMEAERGSIAGDDEAVDEWTGSEDQRVESEFSEDESIGEWSNPSDEERARQERLKRSLHRRAMREGAAPRRLPDFPRPPETQLTLPIYNSDDMITNPSEDETAQPARPHLDGQYLHRTPVVDRSPHLFEPVSHSRVSSGFQVGQEPSSSLTARTFSANNVHLDDVPRPPSQGAPRRDSLNPFAKPFVFGLRQSGSWVPPSASSPIQHSRNASSGKPLNAAAVEFTPISFNFRPAAGVSQLIMPPTEPAQPVLPAARVEQGREKRQRRGSDSSHGSQVQMASFRFPPKTVSLFDASRASTPSSTSDVPSAPSHVQRTSQDLLPASNATDEQQNTAPAEEGGGESAVGGLRRPTAVKAKRAPVPLDFTQPVSKHTVPAGLFKALVHSGEERTRPSVRSRMSSRDISEHLHRPSMDDFQMPSIAFRSKRSKLATSSAAGEAENIDGEKSPENADPFSPAGRGGSSTRSGFGSEASIGISIPAVDLSRSIDIQDLEERLETLFDKKFDIIRHEILDKQVSSEKTSDPPAQAMIGELASLFRAQLQETAARGDLDLELIKDAVQQGYEEDRALLQAQLNTIVDRLPSSGDSGLSELIPLIDHSNQKAIDAIIDSFSQISAQLEQMASLHSSSNFDQNMLLRDVMDGLAPALASLRPQSIDYEYLTTRLSQAVKPHISQLIDLASDKSETAGLIVDRILPLLPRSSWIEETTDTIISQLTNEIRKAIAPIDAFEIKEQVADLVVERLDSRLALRDRSFNLDNVAEKVKQQMAALLHPLQQRLDTVGALHEGQQAIVSKQDLFLSSQAAISSHLSALPASVSDATSMITALQAELRSRFEEPISNTHERLQYVSSLLEDVAKNQKKLSRDSEELTPFQRDLLERLKALPEDLANVTTASQTVQADIAFSRDALKGEVDNYTRVNAELGAELAEARRVHGQLQAEKESIGEKLSVAEAQQEKWRSEIQELQISVKTKTKECRDMDEKYNAVDEALKQALARLQAADDAAQVKAARLEETERVNESLVSEKQVLTSKVDKLELQLTFANRDIESSKQVLSVLQKQYDHLSSQQEHWDAIRHVSQQIDTIANHVHHADDEEMKELKRIRDRNRALEGEHSALQKRFREQESKIANGERALLTARQSLATANQRSAEWERRAKESEGKYELTQTQLDQLEQSHSQLEADHSLAKLQLEEKEAEERLLKDHESRMREQIAVLEGRLARFRSDPERYRVQRAPSVPSTYLNGVSNGSTSRHTSVSVYDGIISGNSVADPNSRSNTPSAQGGVWDSMHAPKNGPSSYTAPNSASSRPRISSGAHYRPSGPPSPTLSVVTRRDDGWWDFEASRNTMSAISNS